MGPKYTKHKKKTWKAVNVVLRTLIFTNMEYNELQVIPIPSIIDHSLVTFEVQIAATPLPAELDENRPLAQRLDTRNLDENSFRHDLLRTNCEEEFSDKRPNEQKQYFIDKIVSLMQNKSASINDTKKYKPPKVNVECDVKENDFGPN